MSKNFVEMPPLKRFFDIIISLALIIIYTPFWLIFFATLMIEYFFSPSARGPLFYCEQRISGGRKFKLCKIRVCRQSVIDGIKEKHGFVHTAEVEKDKSNFLKVGWIIKKIYLDESPQFFNVLSGDISLVGPRPPNIDNYQKLIEKGIRVKMDIRAGLTGSFQSYKGNFPKSDVELDQEYIDFCRSHSQWQILWFDFKIIFRTIGVILEHKGI